jgi:hypothetical protein
MGTYQLRPSVKKVYQLRPSVKKVYQLRPSVKKVYQLRPSVKKVYQLRPLVKKVYQLRPNVSASGASYRHTTKRLRFAPPEQSGKRTRSATRDTHARARSTRRPNFRRLRQPRIHKVHGISQSLSCFGNNFNA